MPSTNAAGSAGAQLEETAFLPALLPGWISEFERGIASPAGIAPAYRYEPHGSPGSDTASSTVPGQTRQTAEERSHGPTTVCFHTRDNIQVFSSGTASQALEVFPKLSDK
jgi:hypothetical protein